MSSSRRQFGKTAKETCTDLCRFGEPMLKINTGRFDSPALNWSEAAGWDAEADFFKAHARI